MTKQEDVIVTFNGKKHTLSELARMETAAADEDASVYWKGQDEQEAIYKETAVTKNKVFRKKPKKLFKSYRKPRFSFPSISKSLWIPLLSAIVVGLGLGFTVLVFFSHHNIKSNQTAEAVLSSNQKQTAQKEGGSSSTKFTSGDLSLNMEVIQTAAVSSKSKASTVEKQMNGLGIPTVTMPATGKDLIYVFIGLAQTKSQATQMADVYQAQGAAVYVKPWNIKDQAIHLSNKSLYQALKAEHDVLTNLISASSDLMVQNSVSPAIQKAIDTNTKVMAKLVGKTPKNIQALSNDINRVSNLVSAAIKQPTQGNERLVQQKLLNAIHSYQQLLASFSK